MHYMTGVYLKTYLGSSVTSCIAMKLSWSPDSVQIGDKFLWRPGPTGATDQQAGNVD